MEADPCEDLTCTLLDMSCDWHAERVTQQARDALRALGSSLLVLMDRIMTHALLSLASAVKRIHDADVQMHARRVRMCASLLSHDLLDVQMGSPHMAFLRVASHHGDFHWWFDALMQSFCVHELTNGVLLPDPFLYIRQRWDNSNPDLCTHWDGCGLHGVKPRRSCSVLLSRGAPHSLRGTSQPFHCHFMPCMWLVCAA